MKDIQETKNDFVGSFGLEPKNEDIIVWIGGEVGFSILKEYPENTSFIPIKNRDGKTNDSVALLRFGYDLSKVKENKVIIWATISKGSKYLFNHFSYNFQDESCPHRESVIISEKSKQPAELDHYDRFEYDVQSKKFFDLVEKREVTGVEIIDYIYDLHIKTIDYLPFRAKRQIKKLGFNLLDLVSPFLKKSMRIVDREVTEDRTDWIGVFKPYIFSKHVRSIEKDKINLWGVPVPKGATIIGSTVVFVVSILDFNHLSTFSVANFITKELNSSQVFIFSAVIVSIFVIDYFLPRIILWVINLLIKIRNISSRPTKIT